MTVIKTPDFNPEVLERQVNEAFQLLLTENRSILGTLISNGTGFPGGTNQKYEWLESQLAPTTFTVDGLVALAANPATTTVTFDSTVGMSAGMIFTLTDTSGNDVLDSNGEVVVLYVDAVLTATTADVVIINNIAGTPTATLPDDAVARFTDAEDENKKVFAGENDWQPAFEYNNFQIFSQELELSDTVMKSLMYGDANMSASQLKEAMYKMAQKMQIAASKGERTLRGSTLYGLVTSKGTLSGYQRYIDVAGGNVVDGLAAAINPTLINDAAQAILEDGGNFNTIICNYAKAREISAFNTSGANPLVQLDRAETTTGSYVVNFQHDMPVDGGLISRIIIDNNISNDKVFLVDINRIALVPFNGRATRLVETTANGQDGRSWDLRGEYTLVVKDGKKSHAVIKNLA